MIKQGDRAMFRAGPHAGEVGHVEEVEADQVVLRFRADKYMLEFSDLIFDPVEPAPAAAAPHRKTTDATRDDWRTPRQIFEVWSTRFRFDLDAAASPENRLCDEYCAPLTIMDNPLSVFARGYRGDALKIQWPDQARVWINPPFSQARDFAVAAITNAPRCAVVVVLVPSATDTRYWRSLAEVADEIWLSSGRISFVHPHDGEPVPGNPVGSTIFVLRGTAGRPPFVGFFDAATGSPRGRFGPEVFGAFQLRP